MARCRLFTLKSSGPSLTIKTAMQRFLTDIETFVSLNEASSVLVRTLHFTVEADDSIRSDNELSFGFSNQVVCVWLISDTKSINVNMNAQYFYIHDIDGSNKLLCLCTPPATKCELVTVSIGSLEMLFVSHRVYLMISGINAKRLLCRGK